MNEPANRHKIRYPHREKTFFSLYWTNQGPRYNPETKRLRLPMGRGTPSIVLKVELAPDEIGAMKLVWNDGAYELHACRPVDKAENDGTANATIDLGEIHQATVVADTGRALIVSGRGIRSIKRQKSKQLGEIAAKRSKCRKGSRRHRRLTKARQRRSLLAKRRIRDLRHKGTRLVIDFCADNGVRSVWAGNPDGVRKRDCGRKHNQRMACWEYGIDLAYLGHKAKAAGMAFDTGSERGTSSRCPECGHRHKPRGRVWACRKCGFIGHRDIVGAANMHPIAFGHKVTFPREVTYRRSGPERAAREVNNPGPARAPSRRSRAVTPHRESASSFAPMLPVPGSPGGSLRQPQPVCRRPHGQAAA